MEIFIFWFLFSVAVGIYGSSKGRSGFGWFLFSMILSPLLGLIFCAVSEDLKHPKESGPSAKTHVKCPQCAEFVLPEAKVCRHCGAALTPDPGGPQRATQLAARADAKNTLIGLGFVMALFALAWLVSR